MDGEQIASDGTYIASNVSQKSIVKTRIQIQRGMQSYLDALDEELAKEPGFQKHEVTEETIEQWRSPTDPDAGYIAHGAKQGLGYLMQTSVDTRHGLITGVDVFPANLRESSIVLRHLEKQVQRGIPIGRVILDKGYDVGAVHRGLEMMNIEGYIASIGFANTVENKGMTYFPNEDCFMCPNQQLLHYHHTICQKSTGNYLRCYQADIRKCDVCPIREKCLYKKARRRKVLTSGFYPAFYRGRERYQGLEGKRLMKLRAVWAEGTFSMLKREHRLSKIHMRGFGNAKEECFLASIAVNLKRMVYALSYAFFMSGFLPRKSTSGLLNLKRWGLAEVLAL